MTKLLIVLVCIIMMVRPAASQTCSSADYDERGNCKTQLEFQGDIAGATVLIDGKPVEKALGIIEMSPGKHNIEIYKDGYDPFFKSVEVILDRKHLVPVRLSLKPQNEPEVLKKQATPVKQQPKKSRNCPTGMVSIPGVVFWMGSPPNTGQSNEHKQHQVALSAYCIDKMEVSVDAYAACVRAKKCAPALYTLDVNGGGLDYNKRFDEYCNDEKRLNYPMNCVNWYQAKTYCESLYKRLPTEAEWEYAARGDDRRIYPWGNDPPNAKRLNACGTECTPMAVQIGKQGGKKRMYNIEDGSKATAPVDSMLDGRSPFGLLNMAGNVWEWTADWYQDSYSDKAETNPTGPQRPSEPSERVFRGGGWQAVEPWQVSAAVRWKDRPSLRNNDIGFRCAKDLR